MALEKYDGRKYGDGRILGYLGMAFFEMSLQLQAEMLGYSDACPVAPSLISDRGAAAMIRRYGEVNYWFGTVAEKLQESGQYLAHSQLITPLHRLAGESMGRHDPGWPPEELETHMFGPGTPLGYAIPRLVIAYLEGDPSKDEINGRHKRFAEVLNIIDETASGYVGQYELAEFTVLLADKLIREGVNKYDLNPALFFRHLLGTGKLSEDNCRQDYKEIIRLIYAIAPELGSRYSALDVDDYSNFHIAMAGADF